MNILQILHELYSVKNDTYRNAIQTIYNEDTASRLVYGRYFLWTIRQNDIIHASYILLLIIQCLPIVQRNLFIPGIGLFWYEKIPWYVFPENFLDIFPKIWGRKNHEIFIKDGKFMPLHLLPLRNKSKRDQRNRTMTHYEEFNSENYCINELDSKMKNKTVRYMNALLTWYARKQGININPIETHMIQKYKWWNSLDELNKINVQHPDNLKSVLEIIDISDFLINPQILEDVLMFLGCIIKNNIVWKK